MTSSRYWWITCILSVYEGGGEGSNHTDIAKQLTILEKIMNCYCFCSYKELQSLLKGYGKVITTRVLRGTYGVSKGVAFAR